MEVKRGKKKKTQKNQEKSRLWRKENKNTEISRKSKKMGKKSLKNKGKTKWRNEKTQKKDGVALKVNERWLQK